ncbi:MAG: polyprenyl synthetase family protein, partial [Desulfomonilia bacterium]|nr:polyprenyl synthetase family protein [Desulfomonilia bacterium]
GDKPALLAGDFISASAFEIVLRQGNLSVALSMIQTIKKMAEGELKELEYAKSFHDNLEIYLDIIYLKTASLFEFCSSAPGHLAGLSPDEIELLGLYGRDIGMGFQIVDDIINLTPNEEDTKDAYNDIAEGKSTLPLVILFRENPEVLAKVQAVKDLLQKRQYLIGHISQDILLRSRDIARNYLVNANERLTGTRFLTGEVSRISSSILSQLEERV